MTTSGWGDEGGIWEGFLLPRDIPERGVPKLAPGPSLTLTHCPQEKGAGASSPARWPQPKALLSSLTNFLCQKWE